MKSFESYRKLVILFWGPICIKNTFYVIACSIPFVLLLFWSVLFEKLDCKHLRGSYLLTFLWISGADLYVTSRWPDTSVFHSPIPALVPRPKFITPSCLIHFSKRLFRAQKCLHKCRVLIGQISWLTPPGLRLSCATFVARATRVKQRSYTTCQS